MIGTASLLLFVLSGAYLFLYQCHYTAYLASRTEGRQLLFQVGAVAALFIILSRILLLLGRTFLPTTALMKIEGLWSAVFATFEAPDLPVYVTAFVLGPFLAQAINIFYRRERASTNTIRRYGTETEKLLVKAMEDQDLILVTLDSRKVYVGWTTYSPEPRVEGKDFRLLPVMSGYRDEQELSVEFTTQYVTTYQKVEADEIKDLQVDDFETMIPLESVVSVGLFSLDVNPEWFDMENLAEDGSEEAS